MGNICRLLPAHRRIGLIAVSFDFFANGTYLTGSHVLKRLPWGMW
jgi:hypothetical protein